MYSAQESNATEGKEVEGKGNESMLSQWVERVINKSSEKSNTMYKNIMYYII